VYICVLPHFVRMQGVGARACRHVSSRTTTSIYRPSFVTSSGFSTPRSVVRAHAVAAPSPATDAQDLELPKVRKHARSCSLPGHLIDTDYFSMRPIEDKENLCSSAADPNSLAVCLSAVTPSKTTLSSSPVLHAAICTLWTRAWLSLSACEHDVQQNRLPA
jgi:hypothetical protein